MKVSEIINWREYNYLIDNYTLYIEDNDCDSSLNICIHEKSPRGGSFFKIIYSYRNGKYQLCGTGPDRENFNEESYRENGYFYCVSFYKTTFKPDREIPNMNCLNNFVSKTKSKIEMVNDKLQAIERPYNSMFVYFRSLKNKA